MSVYKNEGCAESGLVVSGQLRQQRDVLRGRAPPGDAPQDPPGPVAHCPRDPGHPGRPSRAGARAADAHFRTAARIARLRNGPAPGAAASGNDILKGFPSPGFFFVVLGKNLNT